MDIIVLSDIHLGTYGCHAEALKKYLKSVQPKKLILNGDILDIWQFKKRYWPKSHMKVVKQIVSMAAEGVETYYITGNHDEMLRKFSDMKLGSFQILNDLQLDLPGGKAWFFHGDVFDVVIQNSKWLAKLGAISYDLLILLNNALNYFSRLAGKGRVSMSKKIKNNVKTAVKYINNFEETAAKAALNRGFKYVVCGHIHQAQKNTIHFENGEVVYLNSGDWVESLTSLEYSSGSWKIYDFNNDPYLNEEKIKDTEKELAIIDMPNSQLLKNMLDTFQKTT